MGGRIQKSKIISLCAILGVLSFQTAVVAKKKPKRRSARAKATKRVTLALPAFVLRNVQATTTAPNPAANTPRMMAANTQRMTTPKAVAPTLSLPHAASAGQLVISEFRLRGPNGTNDEFIEIYNNSGADHTVQAADASAGYALAASDGVTRFTIPNGTVIPNRGHYLGCNSVGYSLASYPAGNGTTAICDATYTANIHEGEDLDGAGPNPPEAYQGIALFNNSTGGGSFSFLNRIDAVGPTSEANTLYKEGTGYAPLIAFSIEHSFYRDNCGKSGSITTFGPCPISTPKDTDNNAADFIFVDTNGTPSGTGVNRIGAPGPEGLNPASSPIQRNSSLPGTLLDPCVANTSAPNRARDTTSDPGNNSQFGTLEIRRTITNNTGANVTRLRFRVIDITTFEAPIGIADLRARSSGLVVVTVDRAPCGVGVSNVTVQGTTLEQPPAQLVGGGFNSTLSAGTITLATPLPPVDNPATVGIIENELNVRFLFGVQQTGLFKVYMNIEALP
jgi:hypothetical protein